MHVVVDKLSVTLQARRILSDISFAVQQSQTVGLLGPNGSGKSTLIRAMAGIQSCVYSGLKIGGKPASDLSQRQLSRALAFVPQHAESEAQMSVIDIVRLGRTPHRNAFTPWCQADEKAVQQALSLMKLNALAHRTWQRLSGGERQRCQIARALTQQPDILLLDEPINHLDIQFQLELMRLISALPITVIVALHDLNLAAKYCQHLVVLQEGQVVASGEPAAVLTPELIQSTWQVNATIYRTDQGNLNIQYA